MIGQVEKFLAEWSATVRRSGATFIPRENNIQTMLMLGLGKLELEGVLSSLRPDNYSRGPEPDDGAGREGEIWVFGTELQNREVYIKIKLVEADGEKSPICLSFHFAEFVMTYPLRRT